MNILKRFFKEIIIFYFDIIGMIVYLLRFPSKDNIKRILIIRPDHFGDVILTTTAIYELRKRNPDSIIDIIVKSYSLNAIKNNPHISSYIVLNLPWCCHKFQIRDSYFKILNLIIKLRRKHYNEIYIFQEDFRNNIVAGLIGGQKILGYGECGCFSYLTNVYENLKYDFHEVDKILNLLEIYKPSRNIYRPYYFPIQTSEIKINEFLKNNNLDKFVVIHPGAGYYKRCWTKEGFIYIINKLNEMNISSVISYTDNEKELSENIIQNTRSISFYDHSIDELAVLIKKSILFIGHDSGPMHLASAVDQKIAAIFGPSNPNRWGPFSNKAIIIKNDLDCMPCSSKPKCSHVKCLKELDQEYVFKELVDIIQREI